MVKGIFYFLKYGKSEFKFWKVFFANNNIRINVSTIMIGEEKTNIYTVDKNSLYIN